MMSKLKKAAPYIGCFAAGVTAGLALAGTAAGIKLVNKISALRGKAA